MMTKRMRTKVLHTPNDYCGGWGSCLEKSATLLAFVHLRAYSLVSMTLQSMANLSSSWKPATLVSSTSRAPSALQRARSPFSRPSSPSPSPQGGESAITDAWRNALNSYRRSLSDKDFKRIMIPAGPEDVANEVEKWQCRQSASRYARVAAAVRAGVNRMQRFSDSIDMLVQGSPSPGCLLWGSIKFVLTVGFSLLSCAPAKSENSVADWSLMHAALLRPKILCPCDGISGL